MQTIEIKQEVLDVLKESYLNDKYIVAPTHDFYRINVKGKRYYVVQFPDGSYILILSAFPPARFLENPPNNA